MIHIEKKKQRCYNPLMQSTATGLYFTEAVICCGAAKELFTHLKEIIFLILFPILVAISMLFLEHGPVRKFVIWISSFIIMGVGISLAAQYFFSTENQYFLHESEVIDKILLGIEVIMAGITVFLGFKHRKYYVSLLSIAQTGLILWLELTGKIKMNTPYHLFADKLSIVMEVIIAVVGALICIYALGYMKDYHEHHKEYKDRRKMFYALLYIFLSAMFGLVFSNNLIWIYFFWEVTTLCSFFLIKYTGTKEAVNNAFKALWMNLLGGLAFSIAITYCVLYVGTLDLNELVQMGPKNSLVIVPVMLLSFAALIKSAQLPFSPWLLGAMVGPTPSSALLHSATMVKAGVYILVRLSPALRNNMAGYMVVTIGGFTFLVASMIAISQNDAKKLLAYSTVANLGLISACAGIGMYESAWAAIFLIIFHAVSKSLMFLSVGAVENSTGSRDIEDMHGMIIKQPQLAFLMMVGIAGMFLAPFGMLISKWAALKSFIDSNNVLLVLFLCFGSAATLFYWTKWMGKLVAVLHYSERLPNQVRDSQWFSMIVHAALMVGLCLTFPLVSQSLIQPFLKELYHQEIGEIIGRGNMNIMSIMLSMIVIIPFSLRVLAFNKKNKIVTAYMSGVNYGDDRGFVNSFGKRDAMYLSNWYMNDLFGEKKLLLPSIALSAATIVTMISIMIGSVIK